MDKIDIKGIEANAELPSAETMAFLAGSVGEFSTEMTNPPRYVQNPDWTQSVPDTFLNGLVIQTLKGQSVAFGSVQIDIPQEADVTSALWGIDNDVFDGAFANTHNVGIAKTNHLYRVSFGGEALEAHTMSAKTILSLVQVGREVKLGFTMEKPWVQNVDWSLVMLKAVNDRVRQVWATLPQPVFQIGVGLVLPQGLDLVDQAVRLEGGGYDEPNGRFKPVSVVMELKLG